jgi:hypothetical protein
VFRLVTTFSRNFHIVLDAELNESKGAVVQSLRHPYSNVVTAIDACFLFYINNTFFFHSTTMSMKFKCPNCPAEVSNLRGHKFYNHASHQIPFYGESCSLLFLFFMNDAATGQQRRIYRANPNSPLICICKQEFQTARMAQKHARMMHSGEMPNGSQNGDVRA